MQVRILDIWEDPPEEVGVVSIVDGELRASTPEVADMIRKPAGGAGLPPVAPAPTEEYLRALWLQYQGRAVVAEWID